MPAGIRLILASGSPRREELLRSVGLDFHLRPAAIDEIVRQGESARDYVERLAQAKAEHAAALEPDALVLAADTAVVIGGEILGKPLDDSTASRMLRKLSGKAHTVLTGVAIAGLRRECLCVETEVQFRALSESEIAWYVKTGEPFDKAGGYAIQGKGGALIEAIRGSFSNVIGLPLSETLLMLAKAGVKLPWSGN